MASITPAIPNEIPNIAKSYAVPASLHHVLSTDIGFVLESDLELQVLY